MNNKVISVQRSNNSYITYRKPLKEDDMVFQVHRAQQFIDFVANREALKELSPDAYSLYMYMITNKMDAAWPISAERIKKVTKLTEESFTSAWQELLYAGYLTAGQLDLLDQPYKTNAYHIWEIPCMSHMYVRRYT